jgi:hypothetical protein
VGVFGSIGIASAPSVCGIPETFLSLAFFFAELLFVVGVAFTLHFLGVFGLGVFIAVALS